MKKIKWGKKVIKDKMRESERRAIYKELSGTTIPSLTDELEMQVKIEDLAITWYLLGYKQAEKKMNQKVAYLKYQREVKQERINELEEMLKEAMHK